MELEKLTTETRNTNSTEIDQASTVDMLKIINSEDQKVAERVAQALPVIANAIDLAADKFILGARLIYIGAGTSGRLGILDAVELVPTYNVPPDRAIGLIAGGNRAIFKAVEGAEDSLDGAVDDLKANELEARDIVIGVSASGRTPYVVSGLDYARKIGALTISVSNNLGSEIGQIAQVSIEVPVGPEVITGSTRMKAGTAQKMILNMISTGIMVKVGKVYQNLMINVLTTNEKLIERGIRIISEATGVDRLTAEKYFEASHHKVNVTILMIELKISLEEAESLLVKNDGNISRIIHEKVGS